jgi:lysophospholipase L1-like esterase
MPGTNRRQFLKTGAACSGVMAAGVAASPGAEAQSTPGGYDYRRPSFPGGSRLLFIGDSITDMKWGRNEKDRNHYLGHSYVYLIAARLGVDLSKAGLEFFNRGISGNRMRDLKARWQKDVIEMKPDLLSVLVGVNDRVVDQKRKFEADQWEADYREVLKRSREANPDLRIVLIDPFVLQSGWWMTKGGQWEISRAQIDRMGATVTRLAKEFGAVQVRMQDVFDAAAKAVSAGQWIWDGVHPLPQGHELIARQWLEEVSGRWKAG